MQQFVKEELCSYNSFINQITELVKEFMGDEFTVHHYKVMKNNSLELDSLVILKRGKYFAPNIYLQTYYEEYTNGADLVELTKKLCNLYRGYEAPTRNSEFSFSFKDVKSKIIYRLVSYDRNQKLLQQIPHIKFLDLAITFHYLVNENYDGIGTIRVTNAHMRMWESSLRELYQLAVTNTTRLFPYSIKGMDEVILGMLKADDTLDLKEGQSETLCLGSLARTGSKEHRMYILTNHIGINGATCLLYKNILKEFSSSIQSDLFIIPSSIHEVILVPADKTMTKETLNEMVRDVNNTQVAKEEILSDHVYYYSNANNRISF